MTEEQTRLFDTKFWYLRDHHLLSILSSAQLKMICFMTKFKTAQKGEVIYFSGADTNRVYLIKSGSIKIVGINDQGDEVVKELLQKGDLFGSLESVSEADDAYEQAVVLSPNAVFCSFLRNDFEQMLEEFPQVALKYTKWIGIKLKRLQSRYANLMFKDVRTRFALFLNDWVEREGQVIDDELIVKNYLTHQDIASLICCTRQTVSQLFTEFKDAAYIDYSRSFVKIKNLSPVLRK